ncbi:TlyA family RNA methyltransferase [Paenibacillus thiaminolyticus]|uniref:TlyA family RNA methyltransferase n=1 Tax=Paenibacillus thiaminolyticus TaxID=49283 RepID=UPI003D2D2C56
MDGGHVNDRAQAESLILAGSVFVNGQQAAYAGEPVKAEARIAVKGSERKYAGKGGLKLEGALRHFQIGVTGRIALDAGASTGGFTDCLLQHAAAQVYAVDVGYGQLAGRLRQDRRVICMEKMNIGQLEPAMLQPKPSLATLDLSYLSLKQAIPIAGSLLEPDGQMLCLVKPLFEANDPGMRRTGVIASPDVYRDILRDLVQSVREIGYAPSGVTHSPVTGNRGTREFFLHLYLRGNEGMKPLDEEIDQAVNAALAIEKYRK